MRLEEQDGLESKADIAMLTAIRNFLGDLRGAPPAGAP
jgi:hypothetical protein